MSSFQLKQLKIKFRTPWHCCLREIKSSKAYIPFGLYDILVFRKEKRMAITYNWKATVGAESENMVLTYV